MNLGDRVYTNYEVRPYIVRACDERYVICTKPFNLRHTVMYFIIDLQEEIRGPDNMVFCNGYETDEQCKARLKELQDGKIEISYRNRVPIHLVQALVGKWIV